MLQFINECVILAAKVTVGTLVLFLGIGIASFLFIFVVGSIGHLFKPKKKG